MSRLYLSNPCALFVFLHTVLRAQSAPGFPCALSSERDNEMNSSDRNMSRERVRMFYVIASEAKQSSFLCCDKQESWIASVATLLAMTEKDVVPAKVGTHTPRRTLSKRADRRLC
jgi:hypothetical protein